MILKKETWYAYEPDIREVDVKLFVVQIFLLGDWLQWFIKVYRFVFLVVMIEEYYRKARQNVGKLESVWVWVQINRISYLC